MEDFHDLYLDPNAGAYELEEVRTGPAAAQSIDQTTTSEARFPQRPGTCGWRPDERLRRHHRP